jgi:hypothetical protein
MRTALLARLGEISIVLHAGDARAGRQEERRGEVNGRRAATVRDDATVMKREMFGDDGLATSNSAVRSGSCAGWGLNATCTISLACCEGSPSVAGAHVHSVGIYMAACIHAVRAVFTMI